MDLKKQLLVKPPLFLNQMYKAKELSEMNTNDKTKPDYPSPNPLESLSRGPAKYSHGAVVQYRVSWIPV